MSDIVEIPSDLSFLLVDPTPSFREGLSHNLRKMGFKAIFQATEATRAFDQLRHECIGFVICERSLPRFSGIELLKEIRENPEFGRVPFVLMGSTLSKEDAVLAGELGVDGYLKKPFVMNDVSSRITLAMQRFQDPENVEARFEDARLAFSEGRYEEAVSLYLALREQYPASARAATGLGRCLRTLCKFAEAESYLKSAVQLNPMYVHAYHELGLLHLDSNDEEQALAFLKKAIELSPGNPIRYESVGDILIAHRNYSEAEEYLIKAVKLEMAYPTLYAQLGKAFFGQKKIEKAAQFFERALKDQPQNTSFLNSMGICMKELGRRDEALTFYNAALKLQPGDVKILFNKALLLVSMKNYERAIKTIDQIIKVDPGFEKAHKKRAEIVELMACPSV